MADPEGVLTALRAQMRAYPEALREALVHASWEAGFCAALARKSARRGDVLHVALLLSRAVGILAQSLYAHARRWNLNEKGAVAVAATLPAAPPRFAERAEGLLGALGRTPEELLRAVDEAEALVAETRAGLGCGGR